MIRPTSKYPWATNDITYDITVKGVTHSVPNKSAPVVGDTKQDFTVRGITYYDNDGERVTTPVQYINNQLYGAYAWINHLDGRYANGDVYPTTVNEAQTTINNQLGGQWILIGTASKFGETVYYWKKQL